MSRPWAESAPVACLFFGEGRVCGEGDGDGGAGGGGAVDGDGAAVGFDDEAGVVEALPVAFDGFVALVVAPVVAVEDVPEGGGGDAEAVVGEGDADAAVVGVGAGDGDADFRAGVFQ